MKIRQQMLLILAGAVLLPLALVMLLVKSEMTSRLTAQHESRVSRLIDSVSNQLENEQTRLRASAPGLLSSLEGDDRFRLGLSGAADQQEYVRDTGTRLASAARLDVFEVQDSDGRIITSGHFRMDFGRRDTRFLDPTEPDSLILAEMRVAEGLFPALVQVSRFSMFGASYQLVLGTRVDDAFLNRMAPDTLMTVGLVYQGALLAGRSTAGLARDLEFRYLRLGASAAHKASIRIAHSLQDLASVLDSLNRWLLIAFALVALASVAMASHLARRITRPIADLAQASAHIELDGAGSRGFARRQDEIGQLSRTLTTMVRRLRLSATHLRQAERRAALGDFARQANHDIKNGLTPIRNVFQHLLDVSQQPQELKKIFDEREATITSGIEYLDRLATAYGRLAIHNKPEPLDAAQILRDVASNLSAADPRVSIGHTERCHVLVDSLALRRVIENLVSNALDSLGAGPGKVVLSITLHSEAAEIKVSDSGGGMTDPVKSRLFEDFFTTKKQGSGLGLSIVRRLVMDMNGSIRVESQAGSGATFIIRLPLLPRI